MNYIAVQRLLIHKKNILKYVHPHKLIIKKKLLLAVTYNFINIDLMATNYFLLYMHLMLKQSNCDRSISRSIRDMQICN